MTKNKVRKKIDSLFDGHLERPVSKMTTKEKLHYIWLQMEFKYLIRNRKIIKKADSSNG
jgi:hypothetical protein